MLLLLLLSQTGIEEYFPLNVGNKWVYQVYVPVLEPHFSFDSMVVVDRKAFKGEEFYKVLWGGRTYWFSYHNNELRVYPSSDSLRGNIPFDTSDYDVWLKLPLESGNVFSYTKKNKYKIVCRVSTEKNLYTAGGEFKNCIRVSTMMGDMWFVKGIGVIKMKMSPFDIEIVRWNISD